jgi:hypothetical protein
MKRFFYHDIVDIEWIGEALDMLSLSKEEKEELAKMAHLHLHEAILDTILSELSERDKKVFLANMHYDSSEKTWKHLNANIDKVEDKIIKISEDLKAELKKDLADAKGVK